MFPIQVRAAKKDTPQKLAGKEYKEASVIVDRYQSPYASSSWLLSSRILLSAAEDYLINPPGSRSRLWKRYLCSVGNNLVNSMIMLINHEVNGHGFRLRSLQYKVAAYGLFHPVSIRIAMLLPIPAIGGYTGLADLLERDEFITMVIGGSEANNVLAQQVLLKNFSLKTVDHRVYDLFFKSFTDLPLYIAITEDDAAPTKGEKDAQDAKDEEGNTAAEEKKIKGDIEYYQEKINQKHGSKGISIRDLKRASRVFLFNPILYTSIWAFYMHIFWGKRQFTIPHLKLGNIKYMPLVRMGLTPFGIAYYWVNYVSYKQKTFLFSINAGNSSFYSDYYGGVQIQTNQLWMGKHYGLDVMANLWYQPKLVLQAEDQVEDKNHWGGLLSIDNKLRISKNLILNAGVSYKTKGFVEGISSKGGLGFQGGLTLNY